MPKQVSSKEKFLEVSKRGKELRLKKIGDSVKLKIRTPKHLYVMVLPEKQGEDLAKQTGLTIVRL